MTVDQELRRGLVEEQERANLGKTGIVSLAAVDRRRHQLAFVTLLVAAALLFATLVAAHVIELGRQGWIDTDVARFGIVGFGIAMVIYAFDQERHLRRVVQRRARLEALDGEIASHLLSAGLVLDAVSAVHEAIELSDLLPVIVAQGRMLIGCEHAVLFLVEDGSDLDAVIDEEQLASAAAPIAELVLARRGVVGIVAEATMDIGVPIGSNGSVLAVLVLPTVVADRLTDDTREVLDRFGRAAGSALANARRYEAAMFLLDVG